MTFGGNVSSCTTMFAKTAREWLSVKRIAPYRMATPGRYQYVGVRRPTHGLAIQMRLSREDDYVCVDVMIIIFEASYR